MGDSFLKESCKSYQKCQIANSARRNSLMKKTIGIEAQRKIASHQLDREKRQLREQLKNMKIEQAKTTGSHDVRERANSDSRRDIPRLVCPPGADDPECIDPYPVTFGAKGSPRPAHRQRSMTMVEKAGLRYAAKRGRRVSKEFEDLSLNTATGTLAIPSQLLLHAGSRSASSSATSSPTSPRRGIGGSHSSLDSTDCNSHWAGDPEAIHSVRRPRKSVEQQEKEKLMRVKGEVTQN